MVRPPTSVTAVSLTTPRRTIRQVNVRRRSPQEPNRPGRNGILALAISLAGRRGWGGTTYDLLAEGLGVTKAGIYHHFRSKEALLAAVVEPYLAAAGGLLARVGSPEDLLLRYLDLLIDHEEVARFVHTDAAVAGSPSCGDRLVGLDAAFGDALAEGHGAVPAQAALSVLRAAPRLSSGSHLRRSREEWLAAALRALRSEGTEGQRGAAPLEASLDLEPRVEEVSRARAFVRDTLLAWRVDLEVDLELMTGELVNNAVVHAGTELGVCVRLHPRTVRVEVSDGDERFPVFSAAPGLATSGRGLLVVAEGAAAWGFKRGADRRKVVWFEVQRH